MPKIAIIQMRASTDKSKNLKKILDKNINKKIRKKIIYK